MEKIIFRKALKADLKDIVHLLADDEFGQEREVESDLTPYAKTFCLIDQDENQMLMVACIKDKIIGTAHLTIMPSLTFVGSIRLNIEAVRIAPSCQGQEFGTRMIQEAINWGRQKGATIIQLATNKQRTGVKKFYENLGFKALHEGMKLYL